MRNRFSSWQQQRAVQRRWKIVRRNLKFNRDVVSGYRDTGQGRPLVAIVQIEHIGDIVACEPAYRHIRSLHPDSFIIWITKREYKELLSAHPAINAIADVNCLTEATLLAEAPLFDHVFNLHVNRRRCTWFHGEWQRSDGNPEITVDNYYDYGSLLEAFSQAAGLARLSGQPRLAVASCRAMPAAYPAAATYVVVHALTNEEDRNWKAEKWAQLVQQLRLRADVPIVEVGTKSIVARDSEGIIDLCGKLTLPQLSEVIRQAALFVGVDSGPAQIANAAERPSVILIGSYRKWPRYMPYTGFLREHATQMLLQSNGSTADIPVGACVARIHSIASPLVER